MPRRSEAAPAAAGPARRRFGGPALRAAAARRALPAAAALAALSWWPLAQPARLRAAPQPARATPALQHAWATPTIQPAWATPTLQHARATPTLLHAGATTVPAAAPSLLPARAAAVPRQPSEGAAFLSSLVAPGLAQYRQGRRRWVLYAGVELLGAAAHVVARGDAQALRRDYRDFAWKAARAGVGSAPRVDGGFEYYERLSQWSASGRWDADPSAPGLQPESDPSTYNGSVWALAMRIHGVDPAAPHASPGYAAALGHYRRHGYDAAFLWAWRGGGADQDRFAGLIARSDSRFRDARLALGVLVANHLTSAIDGFATARLRMLDDGAAALTVTLPLR